VEPRFYALALKLCFVFLSLCSGCCRCLRLGNRVRPALRAMLLGTARCDRYSLQAWLLAARRASALEHGAFVRGPIRLGQGFLSEN